MKLNEAKMIEFFFDVNVPENVPENRLERIKKKDDR